MKIFLFIPIILATLVQWHSVYGQEWTVSAGIETHRVEFDTLDPELDASNPTEQGLYLSTALRKTFGTSQRHKLGFGLDISDVNDDQMVGFRALDYQYQWFDHWRIGGFFGVASLDSGLPQNGYYTGVNTTFFPASAQQWSFSIELSHGNGLGRDRIEEFGDFICNCPQNDIFIDFYRAVFKVDYYFH